MLRVQPINPLLYTYVQDLSHVEVSKHGTLGGVCGH